jgi:hypothetical protein
MGKKVVHTNVPNHYASLDFVQLPIGWLAIMDVHAASRGSLSSTVAVQPRARWFGQNPDGAFSRYERECCAVDIRRRRNMGDSKKTPRPTPHLRSVSNETLRKKMSELISLRERVAQAELAAGVGLGGFAPTGRDPNEDDSLRG